MKQTYISLEIPEVDYIARLQKWFKTEGIIGFGFTRNPYTTINAQQIAKEMIEMHEAYKCGNYVDITNQEL